MSVAEFFGDWRLYIPLIVAGFLPNEIWRVLGLVMVAADLGYEVVVVTDAVPGMPLEYGDAVLASSIGALASSSSPSIGARGTSSSTTRGNFGPVGIDPVLT